MSYYDTFMRWLTWPIITPLEWFFRHRCKLDAAGCCLHEYCPEGKEGVVGWGQSNERWVRRNPLPSRPPKAPPPPLYRYKDGYTANSRLVAGLTHTQINGMLREAHRRTQR